MMISNNVKKILYLIFLKLKKKLKRIGLHWPFPGSNKYWEHRYKKGGNSGNGSYGELAKFKAEFLNDFIEKNKIESVIEFGCGDGNQLQYLRCPNYIGFDVSETAVDRCRNLFKQDTKKNFFLLNEYKDQKAELSLSLDVIFHLVEDNIYIQYMTLLFRSSKRYVIIYSSDFEKKQENHERRRKFTDWINTNISEWELIDYKKNRYPFDETTKKGSLSDFYVYKKL